MRILLQLFGGRGSGSRKIYLNYGRQGKHWEWHNNYKQGKSKVTVDPEKLQELVSKFKGRKHGQREVVDFGEIIGQWFHEGSYYETTRGKIHWGKDGGYHVVPAPPNGWDLN